MSSALTRASIQRRGLTASGYGRVGAALGRRSALATAKFRGSQRGRALGYANLIVEIHGEEGLWLDVRREGPGEKSLQMGDLVREPLILRGRGDLRRCGGVSKQIAADYPGGRHGRAGAPRASLGPALSANESLRCRAGGPAA